MFGEEDPEWSGSNYKEALGIIKKFARVINQENYKEIIIYIKKLLPLWKMRLVNKEEFPDNRPTLNSLFGGKKYFWSNRKVLYNRWKKHM